MGGFASSSLTRRAALIGGVSALGSGAAAAEAGAQFAALEGRAGGRLGVFAIETGSGRALTWRADERFLMCSTFKLLLAGAVLARIDAGQERPDRPMTFSASDLLATSPVTGAHVKEGALPLETLCQAAVEESDNTAANLLLKVLGGPEALTRFTRSMGDPVTRHDRYEMALNRADGVLDTTSPRAMTSSARKLLLGEALHADSRKKLEGWMRADKRGANRIRVGVPKAWAGGSKPGTSDVQTNDVAILRPPGRAPILVAAFYASSPAPLEAREAVLRQVGEAVARWAG
jgi:beta-lactamase class A